MADIRAYNLDDDAVNYVLRSRSFTASEKKDVIDLIDEDLIISNGNILKTITQLIFDHHPFTVSKEIIIAALQQPFPITDRVKLFNMHYALFIKTDIPVIFMTFPFPYSDISILYTSPVIDHSQENFFLANNLKTAGFVANFKDEKKGIRIINFKKNK